MHDKPNSFSKKVGKYLLRVFNCGSDWIYEITVDGSEGVHDTSCLSSYEEALKEGQKSFTETIKRSPVSNLVSQGETAFSSGKFKTHRGIKTKLIIYTLAGYKGRLSEILMSEEEPELIGYYRLVCKQKIDGEWTTSVIITTQSVEEVVIHYMDAILQFTTGMEAYHE